MTTKWHATISVNMSTSATTYIPGKGHVAVMSNRNTIITVPDAGGYFTTKALLETSYGQGSVLALHPAD